MALVLYNPVSGSNKTKAFFDEHVLPLLKEHNIPVAQVLATEREGHAGSVAFEYFDKSDGSLDIIVGGGDGTLHEIISAIALSTNSSQSIQKSTTINFVLVPCGTANALYSSLFPPTKDQDPIAYGLRGINAFINKSTSKAVPLTLAITSILSPPHARAPPVNAIAAVVTSTAFHASIVHDSEALRVEIPSIERFKVAAGKNITRWYKSFVKLLPSQSTGLVEIYDPSSNKFVPHPDSDHDDPIVDLDGPFEYFLSSVNVDRLEPAFVIAPLVTSSPRTGAFMDVVVLRPLRDPSIPIDTPESRTAFAMKAGGVLTAAYSGGLHVKLRYDSEGDITLEGDGHTVVEYFRCGGWEWEPVRVIFHY